MPLSGRKIIFFGPKTFNYEKEITDCLERLGADVIYQSDKPSEHPWVKAFIRLFPRLAYQISDRFYDSWLRKEGPETCDTILIVKGEGSFCTFHPSSENKI